MTSLQQFDIATAVTDSLIAFFKTRLAMDLALSDDSAVADLEGMKIAGSVHLAGKVLGCINIHVSEEFGRILTAAMLGMAVDDIEREEDVNTVIGEICNVVGGNLTSKLCDSGMTCRLSLPLHTRGNDFQIESLNTARLERYVLIVDRHPIIVDVGVKNQKEETTKSDSSDHVEQQSLPVDEEAFANFDIQSPISDALIEMFDMMLSMDLERHAGETDPEIAGERVVGAVGFVGPIMGGLKVFFSKTVARVMTANMLGVETEEVDGYSDVKDVISEVCNAVGGKLISRLWDAGFSTQLSSPSMTVGSDFTMESQNMAKYEKLAFRYKDEFIVVEMGAKIDDEMPVDTMADAAGEDEKQEKDPAQANVDGDVPTDDTDKTLPESNLDTEDAILEPLLSDKSLCHNLEFLLDVPVAVTVELGRTRKKIQEILDVVDGSIVELTKLAHEPVDIRVNNTLIAKGEIVVDKDKYGVRILETISRMQRIRSL